MGALVAAVAKRGEDVVPSVVRMLHVLRHRGEDAYGIATHKSLNIAHNVSELTSLGIESDVVLGHNFSRIVLGDIPQPIQHNDTNLVFEGRLFPSVGKCDAIDAIRIIKSGSEGGMKHLIEGYDGSYVVALQEGKRIISGRDPVGTVPLYYGENSGICAVASERKALFPLGISHVKSFPPGNIAVLNSEGIFFKPVKTISRPLPSQIGEEAALMKLHSLLLRSVEERTRGIDKTALAFSGGLDSSIIALLVKECGKEVLLVTVGMEGEPELTYAEDAADKIGLPLQCQSFTVRDVETVLDKVLWLVEEPDPLKVSVAIPFFWTSDIAAKNKLRILFTGQGSDELFGGYQRYLREYGKSREAAENALYHDISFSYETNFERDNKVCAFHGVELRLPFADQEVISFSLSLPIDLKLYTAQDPLRKRILRRLAKKVGLPSEVYDRPKKAIQYGTGVHRALRKLAKKREGKLIDFINQIFRERSLRRLDVC